MNAVTALVANISLADVESQLAGLTNQSLFWKEQNIGNFATSKSDTNALLLSIDAALLESFVNAPLNVTSLLNTHSLNVVGDVTDQLYAQFFAIQNQTTVAKAAVLATLLRAAQPLDTIPFVNVTLLITKIADLDAALGGIVTGVANLTFEAKTLALAAIHKLDSQVLPTVLALENVTLSAKFAALNSLTDIEVAILSGFVGVENTTKTVATSVINTVLGSLPVVSAVPGVVGLPTWNKTEIFEANPVLAPLVPFLPTGLFPTIPSLNVLITPLVAFVDPSSLISGVIGSIPTQITGVVEGVTGGKSTLIGNLRASIPTIPNFAFPTLSFLPSLPSLAKLSLPSFSLP